MKISLDYIDGWWTLDENINDHIRFFIKIFQYWLWVLLPGKRYLAEKAGVDLQIAAMFNKIFTMYTLKHSRSVVGSFTFWSLERICKIKKKTLRE